MNIGRPKGYVPPVPGAPPLPPQPKAPAPAPVPVAGLPSSTLLLNNILPAGQLRSEEDRKVVSRPAQRSAGPSKACLCWAARRLRLLHWLAAQALLQCPQLSCIACT